MNAYRGTGIGFISQEPISSLNPAFTVGHQLEEAVRLHQKVGRSEARREDRARAHDPRPTARAGRGRKEVSSRTLRGYGSTHRHRARARGGTRAPDRRRAHDGPRCLGAVRDPRPSPRPPRAERDGTHPRDPRLGSRGRGVRPRPRHVRRADRREQRMLRSLISRPEHPYTRALLQSSSVGVAPRQLLPVIAGTVPTPGSWPLGCRFASRCDMVEEDCRAGPIPMVALGEDAGARCIRAAAEAW